MSEPKDFINVRNIIGSKNPKLLKWIPGFIIRYIERILHQREINQFLKDHPTLENQAFCSEVVNYFNITFEVKNIERIPKTGKAVLAMNHPLGGMDAMILVDALKDHRTDIKFIVNDLLMNLVQLRGIFAGVNKHGKTQSESLKKVNELFESDQLIGIFPAGLVSRKIKGEIQDLEWKKTFFRQSKKNNQTIIPIYIEGKLSPFFYRLSNIRKFFGIKANIEMLYLADELFKQRNQHITFIVGEPMLPEELKSFKNDQEGANEVRKRLYSLKQK